MREFVSWNVLKTTILFLSIWTVGGCSEDDNPTEVSDPNIITGNLFPLAAGRLWVSTAHQTDTLGQKIESTTHRDVLYARSSLVYEGKPAFLMVDSIYHPTGDLNYVDSTYMATDEKGEDFYLYLGEWVSVFKRSEGVNKEYVAATFATDFEGFDVDLTVSCKILPRAPVTVPKGTMEAYKLEITYTISLFIFSFQERQNVWFVDGVGPVKFETPPPVDPFSGEKSNGFQSLLVSTNF